MSIDFLGNSCKTTSKSKLFGLCDKPSPAKDQAYIDEVNTADWIAEVDNSGENTADFFAVDHCVTVKRADNSDAKRCDGMLLSQNKLTFVELKDRGSSGWVTVGREQITETYTFFKANNDISVYSYIEAQICNKQYPLTVTNNPVNVQKLLDDTGLILTIDRKIKI